MAFFKKNLTAFTNAMKQNIYMKSLRRFRILQYSDPAKMDFCGYDWSLWEPKEHIHYAGSSKWGKEKADRN